MNWLLRSLARLPRRLAQKLGALIGYANYFLNTQSAKVTRANLELCLGVRDEALVKQSLVQTGRTMMETPAIWLADDHKIDSWIVEVEGEDLVKAAVADDRGLLMLLPHTGNWELFNVLFARYGQMTALYHPPRQAFMVPIMEEVRARRGNLMVPTSRQGLTTLYRQLGKGASVVVLPDQVPANGTFAPFFGEMALTDELTIRLITKTNPIVLGVAIVRRPDGKFSARFCEVGDALYSQDRQRSLAALNQLMEQLASIELDQYQWEYKRFKERPAGAKKIYRFSKPPGVHI